MTVYGGKELPLSFGERMGEIRSGFEPAFWVANFTEIFERIAYYSTSAVLAIYLSEQLHFSSVLTGTLLGIAGFVVYALAILAGALADRFRFRRTLMCAYLILTVGYFLLGSLETSWMAPLRNAVGDTWLVSLVLLVPALGPGMVKPCVAGTIARSSTEKVRSLGYSIYYTLVNVGGAIGPMMAWLIRKHLGLGIPNVFRTAAASVFLMFWVVLFFYREPGQAGEKRVASVWDAFQEHVREFSRIFGLSLFCWYPPAITLSFGKSGFRCRFSCGSMWMRMQTWTASFRSKPSQ